MSEEKTSAFWSRRNLIATVCLGIIGTAATLLAPLFLDYWKPDRDQEIGTQTVLSSESSKQEPSEESSKATVAIYTIHVSEVALDIPAAFELGIQVTGNVAARDIGVSLDFGKSEVEACDFQPKTAATKIITENKSYRRLEVAEIQPQERLYIRCLISAPLFSRVIIRGGNLVFNNKVVTFEQYEADLLPEPTESIGFWAIVFRLFVVFILISICFIICKYVALLMERMG